MFKLAFLFFFVFRETFGLLLFFLISFDLFFWENFKFDLNIFNHSDSSFRDELEIRIKLIGW